MAFNSAFRQAYHRRILWRLLAIIILGSAGLYVAFNTAFWLVSFWFFLGVAILTANLIRYMERVHQELYNFLVSVKQGDFMGNYSTVAREGYRSELKAAYEEIMAVFRELRQESEATYQYLNTVVNHVKAALICINDQGKVTLYNPAAAQLFQRPHLFHLNGLAHLDKALPQLIAELDSGQSTLVKTQLGGEWVSLSVHATQFKLAGEGYTLVSFYDIRQELEAQEVESYQKLIRVLNHEIMNSVIPISTLASVARGMVEAEGQEAPKAPGSLDAETLEDVHGSLRTIESRSKGLVRFMKAYKSLTAVQHATLAPTPLEKLLQHAFTLMAPSVEAQGHSLVLDLPEGELVVPMDRELVDQVLINLIKNANEALQGQAGGSIRLSAGRLPNGRAFVELADDGPGISPEIMENIFVPFYTTKANGSGVGLSLARQIMRMHGGEITVLSPAGKGTTFSLIF